MRRPNLALVVVLILAVAVPGALAKAKGKEGGHAFTLESGVLSLVPEIAAALAQIDATPEDALAWRTLGRLLGDRAAYRDAERALEKATKLASDNADGWVDLGAVYLRDNKISSGVSAFQRAIKVEPYHALAHYNLGIAESQRGHFASAMKAFDYALTIDPSLGDPKVNPGAAVNPLMPYVKLQVYLKTTGAAPALYTPLPVNGNAAAPTAAAQTAQR